MKYSKPPLSFEEQAQLLLDRGLIAPDKDALVKYLGVVNYYRLSGYWYPFKVVNESGNNERFLPGTTLEMIQRRYNFDRRLRLLMMDAIEQIEVAVLRTIMVEQYTKEYGPFGYCSPDNFKPTLRHDNLLYDINKSLNRSKEEFIERFRNKYTSEEYFPLWIAAEVMTFGQLFTFVKYMHYQDKRRFAQSFGVYPPVFESWLHTLNFTRNACAHHSRLWNRTIPIKPKLPKYHHQPEWYEPISIKNHRVFTILTILNYLLSFIRDDSEWSMQLFALITEYEDIPIEKMGFPKNWYQSPLWK